MKKIVLFWLGMLCITGVIHAKMGIGVVSAGAKVWRAWEKQWYVGLNIAKGANHRADWDISFGVSASKEWVFTNIDFKSYWIQLHLTDIVVIYLAVGSYINFTYYEGFVYQPHYAVDTGIRWATGLRFLLGRSMDVWIAMTPSLGFYIDVPKSSYVNFDIGGGLGLESGIRYWF